jgi:hypothetical protein
MGKQAVFRTSVGPLTAPFFLAYDLTRNAYIGSEAACALIAHLTKTAAYGAGELLSGRVLLLRLAPGPGSTGGAGGSVSASSAS